MEGSDAARLSPKSVELVDGGDLDLLSLHADELVSEGAWEALDALRQACRSASQRGKQLWAVSARIEYRLCLEAPGSWAALMLETSSGRFVLGPLPEVAASTHSWEDLAPHLHATPQAAMAAHERALRGEDLSEDPVARALPEVLDLPLYLLPWEPAYALAEYKTGKVESPPPPMPALVPFRPRPASRPRPGRAPADEVTEALEQLALTWAAESNGRVEAAGTAGTALDAVMALGPRPREMTELQPETAISAMAWAAGSGGAHGRRRGAARGRFDAWCVLAALAGIGDAFAARSAQVGSAAASARWYAWGLGEPASGWSLRLAVEALSGPQRGQAYALSAEDAF